jgi:glycogen debranching enzyme
MPFFSPFGYGYRFDAMANSLVMLLGVADEDHNETVDEYIARSIVHDDIMLLPAFHPVILPKDEEWDELQTTFSHTFKNAPYEYHNGGLWPLVTGFYAASLAERGKLELARRYVSGIHAANRSEKDGRAWSFPEYLHGEKHTPGGTSPMGWSAAAAVIADRYVRGKRLF